MCGEERDSMVFIKVLKDKKNKVVCDLESGLLARMCRLSLLLAWHQVRTTRSFLMDSQKQSWCSVPFLRSVKESLTSNLPPPESVDSVQLLLIQVVDGVRRQKQLQLILLVHLLGLHLAATNLAVLHPFLKIVKEPHHHTTPSLSKSHEIKKFINCLAVKHLVE